MGREMAVVHGMEGLSKALDRIGEQSTAGVGRIMKEVARAGSKGMILSTPQKTGVLVSNFKTSIGVPHLSFSETAFAFDATKSLTAGGLANAGPAIAASSVSIGLFNGAADTEVHITNSAPYAGIANENSKSADFLQEGVDAAIERLSGIVKVLGK